MGFLDRLLGREQFSQWSAADKAFAQWWLSTDPDQGESVTPYTVIGLSAVFRALQILCTIAGLPLHSYERQGEDKVRMPSVFDDPYPGVDGMTPYEWKETIVIHLALWRHAFLWHEDRSADGTVTVYRPISPDVFKRVYRDSQGKRRFEYTENGETKDVGSEQITYIPGPSLDGTSGHPLLWAARAVFSAAISGDKSAQSMLKKGVRLGGLVTPGDNEEDIDGTEMAAILEALRARAVGTANAGDIAAVNRRVKLQPWTASNVDSQYHETRNYVLMQIEQLFGVPPHLMADTEKQTSWGTGVAEQNLSLARYTLRGWSDRIQERLSLRLPNGPAQQFVEFDYAGLLQGTPEQEIELLIKQIDAGLLTLDEARKIRNLPALTPAQKAEAALRSLPTAPRAISDQQGVAA